jgi:hypothetical protein
MQHPSHNPETADASLLRGRVGPQVTPTPFSIHPASVRPVPHRAGAFLYARDARLGACTPPFAAGLALAAQFPATTGCHPHVSGHRPGAIR